MVAGRRHLHKHAGGDLLHVTAWHTAVRDCTELGAVCSST